jgi:hypothetical protein
VQQLNRFDLIAIYVQIVLEKTMRIETDREFWLRQLSEWREMVRQRELKKLNTQDNSAVNNNTVNKPA